MTLNYYLKFSILSNFPLKFTSFLHLKYQGQNKLGQINL